MNSKIGKLPNLSFPIKVEGKGSIILGDYPNIQREVTLGVGANGKLKIGNNVKLEKNSIINIRKNHNLEIGDDFKLGFAARLYVQNNWRFGNGVKIETNCSIFARESVESGKLYIGNNTHIGDYTIIDIVDNVSIGDEVAIGPNCILYTHDHVYTNTKLPAWKGGLIKRPINIKDGAWIGSGVTILPGVTIGKRAVVAAGSVVTKNIDSETIWGGVPAKLIKKII